MESTGGVAKYSGPCWAEWIPLDIDGVGADPVADALDRTVGLLSWLQTAGADLDALSCWFSGGKGFHVLLPNTGFATEPGPSFRAATRAFVDRIGRESGCGPDLAIYDAVRILRAPNTRHPKTGLFKVPVTADELLRISADGVRRLAAEPRPGDVPEPVTWCGKGLQGIWTETSRQAAKKASTLHLETVPRSLLNRSTLQFIAEGAEAGERANRLFQAAANLGEFGAEPRLAEALLLPAALSSGLPMAECRRTINNGVNHARRKCNE